MKLSHVLLASSIAASGSRADLLGVTYDGSVVRIDPATGATAPVGVSGADLLNSMTIDGQGRYLTVSTSGPLPPQLYVVDPILGTASFLNYPFLNDVRALACSPAGSVFAIDSVGGGVQDKLVELDLSVGVGNSAIARFVGYTSLVGIQGMTFAPDGTLYAWSVVNGLITIDPVSGACVDLDGLQDGTSEIQALAFAPDGTLYGAYDALYVLDRFTGAWAPTATGTFADVRGIEWYEPQATHVYCHAKTNSQGCAPAIFTTGSAGLTGSDDLHIRAAQVLNNKTGFLLWSRTADEQPFQGGSLCLAPTLFRTPAQNSGGGPPPNDCSGSFDYGFTHAYAAAHGLTGGDEISAQYLYRDPPHPDGTGIGLTAGIRIRFLP